MSTQEIGAYCLLLFNAWIQKKPCFLPNDPEVLSTIAKLTPAEWEQASVKVLRNFSRKNGMIYNKKQLGIYRELIKYRKSQSAKGKLGGRPRKPVESRSLTVGKPNQSPPPPPPSPPPTPKKPINDMQSESGIVDKVDNFVDKGKAGPDKPGKTTKGRGLALGSPGRLLAVKAIVNQYPRAFQGGQEAKFEELVYSLLSDENLGLDATYARAYCEQARKGDKPLGYLIKLLSDPGWSPSDESLKTIKRQNKKNAEKPVPGAAGAALDKLAKQTVAE